MSHRASPDDNFRNTPSGSLSRRAAREIPTASATGSSVSQIAKAQTASSSPGRYAKLLNGRRRRKALWAILVLAALILGFTLDYYLWGSAAIFALGFLFDRVKLTYNLSPDAKTTFDRFVESFQLAASSQRVYMIEREGHVANSYQRKVNDGMSMLIRTERGIGGNQTARFSCELAGAYAQGQVEVSVFPARQDRAKGCWRVRRIFLSGRLGVVLDVARIGTPHRPERRATNRDDLDIREQGRRTGSSLQEQPHSADLALRRDSAFQQDWRFQV